MRKINYLLLPVLTTIFLISSCKRESEFTKSIPFAENYGNKTKAWFDNQKPNIKEKLNEIPLWESTQHANEKAFNITPIKIGGVGIGELQSVNKFLITNENSDGEIISGYYTYIVFNKTKNENQNFKKESFNVVSSSFEPNEIQNFNGTILKYDLNYKSIDSKTYIDGKSKAFEAKLVIKNNKKYTEISSFAEIPCGVCIDWYLQTFDLQTGQVLSEIYIYTECGNQNCEGNGGGGGSQVPQSAYNALMAFVNSIVVSNEIKSIQTIEETQTQRTKKLEWKLIKGTGWYIYSWEKGIQKRNMASQDPSTQWQWEAITHEGSSKVGVIVGGSVSHTVTYWDSVLGLYNAIIDAQLTVQCSVLFRGSPLSYDLSYSCQTLFNVNGPYEV